MVCVKRIHSRSRTVELYFSFLRVWTEQKDCRSPNYLEACSPLKDPLSLNATQHSGRHTWAGKQLLETRYIICTCCSYILYLKRKHFCGGSIFLRTFTDTITP